MKFAAIDIGSNAVRLLFQNVYVQDGKPVFHKDSIFRVPLRLGEEAFLNGLFTPDKVDDLVKTMTAFRLLIDVHRPLNFRACATSAMREASNGPDAVERIRKESGLDIEIISGHHEAQIILATHIERKLPLPGRDQLYIDVGGGSTELTVFRKGELADSKSFKIGTLRLRDRLVPPIRWDEMRDWVSSRCSNNNKLTAVGSGGNINKLVKMYGRATRPFLASSVLSEAYQTLKAMPLKQRIVDLGLRPDRADVIVPAARIFKRVLSWAGCKEICAPRFGLADGIIRELYQKHVTD